MTRQPTIAPVVQLGARGVVLVAPFLLSLLGLSLCVIGAWMWAHPAGFVAAGIACFVLEWRVMPGAEPAALDVRPAGTPGPFTPNGP